MAITFEEQIVSVVDTIQRIQETLKTLPWLVWEENQRLLRYSYASKWKCGWTYRYSIESTIYLYPDSLGRGIGCRLYESLLA